MKNNGVKFTEKDILFITKDKTGQIIWLENGNAGAGLRHIIDRHLGQFYDKHSIVKTDLIEHLYNVLTKGTILSSRTKTRKGRDVLEKIYQYKGDFYMLSGVGTNGFLVSAYPLDKKSAKKYLTEVIK